jgi:stalled ribosome rescue protein Dom34
MSFRHCIVWLDHFRATVISFSNGASEEVELTSDIEDPQLHRKSGPQGSGHMADDHHFFELVARQIERAPEILITGPGTAKVAFERFLHERFPSVIARVHGVETVDHPSSGELLAYGRRRFKAIDQLLGDR